MPLSGRQFTGKALELSRRIGGASAPRGPGKRPSGTILATCAGMDPIPLPAAYAAFLERFALGEFWEAHEVLEGEWRASRSGFYKGLILLASACVHAGRGNAHGVEAQLRKTARELQPYAPFYMGQDVAALIAVTRRGSVMPPPDLTPAAALFRGDEPEMT